MVFHWSLGDSKSHQVSRILLGILADLNNAVVWIVSIHHPISNFSIPLKKPLRTVVPITIGITITPMFYSFFKFSSKGQVFFSLSAFFYFQLEVCRDGKVHYTESYLFSFCFFFFFFFFFLSIVPRSGLLAGIRWSIYIPKSQIVLSVSFFRRILVCACTILKYVINCLVSITTCYSVAYYQFSLENN